MVQSGVRSIFAMFKKHRKFSILATTTISISTLTAVNGEYNLNEYFAPVGAGIRFIRSLKIGLAISLDYKLSMLGLNEKSSNYDVMMSFIHKRSAERLLQGCLVNGGTYIKMGQGLVSLSHILPAEYITILTTLQDKCLPRGADEVERLFQEDFSAQPCELFSSFDPEPIAAASLAQVFKARTKDDQLVAVKVQYIDLQTRFSSDVATINFLLKVAGAVFPSFDFSWILKDLVGHLRDELDFINEAKNAERCAIELQHLSYIHVPKIFWNLSNSRVLVTEYVEGIKISDNAMLKDKGFKLKDIDLKLYTAFGEQIFGTGFVHADPHPGNIRKNNNETQLVLLDHGLYQYITDFERTALKHFWKALVLQDHKEMQHQAHNLGVKDYVMLAEILTQRPLKTRNFKLKTRLSKEEMAYMTEFALKRFDNIMKTLKEMPRNLIFVVRNLNTIRAICHDHGDPIDRYTTLARVATKSTITNDSSTRIKAMFTRFKFEYCLFKSRFWIWFIQRFFDFLYFIGRSPKADELLAKMI